MEQIWNAILELTARFVSPDWGSLIALMPLGIAALVVLFFVSRIARFATAGPVRRTTGRVRPVAPPGIHMPGPSLAPIFAAIGAGLLFFGFVLGGTALAVGAVAFALTLLYWGAEGMRDYDHVEGEPRDLVPVTEARQPPPGVHVPGPSFRPLLASVGVALLMFGLVFGGWVLAVGIVALIVTLLGWLNDARKEYVETERADRSGHLQNLPAPGWPVVTLGAFVFLLVVAGVVNMGILPPPQAAGGENGSAAPSAPPASAAPEADVTIAASQNQFQPNVATAPADEPFTLAFTNNDAGVNHNVFITDEAGNPVDMGDTTPFPGPKTVVYQVAPLAAGTYPFICVVHPTMTGELTVGG